MACTIAAPCPTPNITDAAGFIVYTNSVTGGAFGFVMLGMVFIVAFVGMRNYPIRQSIPASLFMTTIMGSLLAAGGIVGQGWIFALLAATIAAAVMLNSSRD